MWRRIKKKKKKERVQNVDRFPIVPVIPSLFDIQEEEDGSRHSGDITFFFFFFSLCHPLPESAVLHRYALAHQNQNLSKPHSRTPPPRDSEYLSHTTLSFFLFLFFYFLFRSFCLSVLPIISLPSCFPQICAPEASDRLGCGFWSRCGLVHPIEPGQLQTI
ncbi:hypothetical protein FN846DRAFT_631521 [Sphaerosporella brunnea]|uniref:Uncharacterized protein n=1 Tax=Sphaerosporella brunnea TaxID=1250544 RepID=A0A5J5ECH0_9PEZI|nr:hypothetical protein FN846DRAFT_631521 [Sphaerosporella brunnea]